MIEWKPEAKVFLPSSYEDWKERIQYIKDVIRQIFIKYELIFDVEEDVILNDVKLDFYLEKYTSFLLLHYYFLVVNRIMNLLD